MPRHGAQGDESERCSQQFPGCRVRPIVASDTLPAIVEIAAARLVSRVDRIETVLYQRSSMASAVGSIAPVFAARALVGDATREIRLTDYIGRWMVLYFYGKDDTAVCESENIGFRTHYPDFQRLGAELLAASVDSIESHKQWRDAGLGPLPFPWIADDQKTLARLYGVLNEDTGIAMRGTFVINPDGVLKHAAVNDLSTGRNISETLRIVQALQTGKPTRCGWLPGEPTL